MGLDAKVLCDCWPERLSVAPPVPVDRITFDDEEGFFDLLDARADPQATRAFRTWMASEACPHRNFELASDRIGNLSSQGQMVHDLAQRRDEFPVLLAMLEGRGNGGYTEADDCALALAELERFRVGHGDAAPCLVDRATGDVIALDGPVAASYHASDFLAVRDGELLVVTGGAAFVAAAEVHGTARLIQGDAWVGEIRWRSGRLRYEPLESLPTDLVPRQFGIDGGLAESWHAAPDVGRLRESCRVTDFDTGESLLVATALPGGTATTVLETQMLSASVQRNRWLVERLTALCHVAVTNGRRLYYC